MVGRERDAINRRYQTRRVGIILRRFRRRRLTTVLRKVRHRGLGGHNDVVEPTPRPRRARPDDADEVVRFRKLMFDSMGASLGTRKASWIGVRPVRLT
jgi:hypothetical protein